MGRVMLAAGVGGLPVYTVGSGGDWRRNSQAESRGNRMLSTCKGPGADKG